jgi:choline dehydrogenase-like flavoprotein
LLIDLHEGSPPSQLEAEVVIIGAGAIGLTMGIDLARRGTSVLVLEAGGPWVTAESQAFFKSARSTGRALVGLHSGRYRALGGTTTFWGGQLAELDALTYGHRPWIVDTDWPIDPTELTPFYSRVFSLLGMDRQIADDAEVWRRVRVPRPEDTSDLEFFFTRWVPESNFARLFGAEIRRSPNITVVVNAAVAALQTDAAGRRVTHAQIRGNGGNVITASAKAFVVASGALETPRLLQFALADGRAAPWSSNPWIGRGFMDHLEGVAANVMPLNRRRFHNLFDNIVLDGIKYQPKLKLSEQAQVSRKLFSISANFLFNSSFSEHMGNAKIFFKAALRGKLDLNFFKYPAQLISLIRISGPMIGRYMRDHRVYNIADRGIEMVIMAEQKSIAASAVTLRDERDALGMQCIDVDWRIDGAELETMAAFTELISDYLKGNELANLEIVPSLANRDAAFLQTMQDTYHHMGTTRMATNPKLGVVDADLKVHETDNLYVAGAAVFPACGFQNPTFAAMALGLRLADALRGAKT